MTTLPLRPDLADVAPYGAPQLTGPIPLNVNENPFAPPPEVIDDIAAAVRQAASRLNRYPDREFGELRAALTRYLAAESDAAFLTPENLWAANGSNEAMLHLFEAFGGPSRVALGAAPTYSMYPEYARDTHTVWSPLPRRADFTVDTSALIEAARDERVTLIVLASPNNPTGTPLPLADVAAICDATWDGRAEAARAVVVIDEAYAEFRTPGTPSAVTLLPRYPHLVVSRTMSKAFALAGARVGYLAAHLELIDCLRRVRLPYHLSAITQAVALAALRHAPALQAQVAQLRAERDDMIDYLRSVSVQGHSLEVPRSHANFVLFGRFEDAHALWEALVEAGVLIREVGPAGFLRVSIGTPAQNKTFRQALDGALATHATSVRPADGEQGG